MEIGCVYIYICVVYTLVCCFQMLSVSFSDSSHQDHHIFSRGSLQTFMCHCCWEWFYIPSCTIRTLHLDDSPSAWPSPQRQTCNTEAAKPWATTCLSLLPRGMNGEQWQQHAITLNNDMQHATCNSNSNNNNNNNQKNTTTKYLVKVSHVAIFWFHNSAHMFHIHSHVTT